MAFKLPPPPNGQDINSPAMRDWLYKLAKYLDEALDLSNVTGVLDVENGGTGLSDIPTNGEILIGNGTGYTQATLTAGANVSITNGAGSITIASSGGGGDLNVDGGTPSSVYTPSQVIDGGAP